MIILASILAYAFVAGLVFKTAAPRLAWKRADRYRQEYPDRLDISNSKIEAGFMGGFWPVVFAALALNKVYNLILAPSEDAFKVRPAPITGPVEAIKQSRIAKAEARERVAKEEVLALRAKVNQQELELGFEPTVWEVRA